MGPGDSVLIEKINFLKKAKNALILAHNYQPAEIQDIADFVGDTLELSCRAAASSAQILVVCGVDFVAETVALFNPSKTVLIPERNAGCPMAAMITAEGLRQKKAENPGSPVVCYLKSPAEVKAESDICCTSSNASAIIEALGRDKKIIFVPDQYLGDYVCTIADLEMDLWPGYCPSHFKINPEDIVRQKEAHPQAKILAHPECTPQVRAMADFVLSTTQILNYARQSDAAEFIVATETGLLHRLKKENPQKVFIAASERAICGKMRMISLESVLWSLENLIYPIQIPEDIRIKAKRAIDRGLENCHV
jgi:quinolinate synthase